VSTEVDYKDPKNQDPSLTYSIAGSIRSIGTTITKASFRSRHNSSLSKANLSRLPAMKVRKLGTFSEARSQRSYFTKQSVKTESKYIPAEGT